MSELLQVYALCVLLLCLKMFAISCYQGGFRLRARAFTNREDAAFFSCAAQAEELPQVVRVPRCKCGSWLACEGGLTADLDV
ncbi:hypothetical protein ACW9I3_26670, partial [Pseudomonas pergaminensis]